MTIERRAQGAILVTFARRAFRNHAVSWREMQGWLAEQVSASSLDAPSVEFGASFEARAAQFGPEASL